MSMATAHRGDHYRIFTAVVADDFGLYTNAKIIDKVLRLKFLTMNNNKYRFIFLGVMIAGLGIVIGTAPLD